MRMGNLLPALLVMIGLACEELTGPVRDEPPVVIPVGLGSATCLFDGKEQGMTLYSNRSGYDEDQIVLRGWGPGMQNVLMMTFGPVKGGPSQINATMTGYWDLGVCIPMNKYLLTNDPDNYILITSFDGRRGLFEGEFSLLFRYEKDPTKTASFTKGRFIAHVDPHPFTYCVEG